MIGVLFVCTGNICRSPLAEVLLRERLGDLPVRVGSAGTRARPGMAMTRKAALSALSLGADDEAVGRHHARLVDEDVLAGNDLILTMTRAHRRAVVEIAPRLSSSTFTLREFARLTAALGDSTAGITDSDPTRRFREVIDRVVASRGVDMRARDAADDDVPDPYRRTSDVYRTAAVKIDEALGSVIGVVRDAHARTSLSG